MLLWPTAALLLALAITSFVVGHVFRYVGVASIGGVLMIVVGGASILDGLDVRTGEMRTYAYQTINNSTVPTETVTEFSYQTTSIGELFGIGLLGELGIGALFMILGAAMLAQTLTEGAF